jgi:dihydroorotase
LVKTGVITLEKLVELMAINPRKRFGLPLNEDYSIWDLDSEYEIDSKDFKSMGKSSPFEGLKVYGKLVKTIKDGKIINI